MDRYLASIDRAAATKTDQRIGALSFDQRLQFMHAAPWHVLPRAFEHCNAPRACGSRHFFKQRLPAQSLPSHHNRALQPTPFELMTERGDFTRPGHHAFQLA